MKMRIKVDFCYRLVVIEELKYEYYLIVFNMVLLGCGK